jgi:hypothetical protein
MAFSRSRSLAWRWYVGIVSAGQSALSILVNSGGRGETDVVINQRLSCDVLGASEM